MKQFACGILVCLMVGSIAAPFSAWQDGVLVFKLNDRTDVDAFDALLLIATVKIDFANA